ncbi:PREDICTED: fatty-acid-binding [Prunus dulcis]|uniref:PREDICTED: fatty-acid-binding n=1 Tax=Prunus dulcis TaxID=3755 RepID=A0A5E4ED90_PRUDU|nr:fatty-acid-binding protein 2 [Prunus dulcis]VVA11708.1 PREDICTED: fatty-acid-binding [Prunus dulcis]
MKIKRFGFMDLDEGSPHNFPVEPLILHSFRGHMFSQIGSFMDNSLHQCRYFHVPGSLALEGAFKHISKLAGALLCFFSCGPNTNATREMEGNWHGSQPGCSRSSHVKLITSGRQNLIGFHFGFASKGESANSVVFGKISAFVMQFLQREAEKLHSHPMLSLASGLVPPFGSLSSNALAVPMENTDTMDQRPCEVGHQGCAGLPFPDLNWRRHAVEPRTGIEFPMILDNILTGNNNSSLSSEVLVGTGSRTMKIIKIKSLKIYAFGFYVHPNSVCKKLGSKYASISVDELNKRRDFYEDLLRADIDMTVRLVVSCNGMKINTVRDAFEKSLRARLVKTNPETDFHCITTFGSNFTQDIPLPAGTTIDFQRTADGKLITKIEGNQIGAVHSKDLCRAFFDMYLGDLPVSEQSKEEIGRNVANIIRRC